MVFTCLHYASLNGHKDIVNLLLEHGANPNIVDHNGSSPLHLASWTGDYEVVNMLITTVNQKADINLKNKDNETALHSACQYGHTPVVSLLLSKGADPFIRNIRSETALDLSAQYGRLDTIELLLRMRFDLLKDYLPINRDPLIHSMHKPSMVRHSPLHLASRNGHKAVVKLLLDLDFDVDYLVCISYTNNVSNEHC
ncbi:Ankyrin repeat [Blomia tropicalis]|nr:Ankyrin repeat [Blomia tropicalis]